MKRYLSLLLAAFAFLSGCAVKDGGAPTVQQVEAKRDQLAELSSSKTVSIAEHPYLGAKPIVRQTDGEDIPVLNASVTLKQKGTLSEIAASLSTIAPLSAQVSDTDADDPQPTKQGSSSPDLPALDDLGLNYVVNEGDGAFYGPKIDFHLEDSLGRTWQCGTVQLDFQMPLNFDLEYVDADGTKKRPIMLHRVCFGSIERFIGILIEHFAGKFPTWLAPVQVKALPVSEKSRDYAHEVCAKLEEAGIRVVCDDRDEKIGYKIREARSIDRVPYMLILGEKEVEAGNISVRDRSNETVQMSVDEFVAKVTEEIKTRA